MSSATCTELSTTSVRTPTSSLSDGLTWYDRVNDLRKLVELQNQGRITRIYTRRMAGEFISDLRQLKAELDL